MELRPHFRGTRICTLPGPPIEPSAAAALLGLALSLTFCRLAAAFLAPGHPSPPVPGWAGHPQREWALRIPLAVVCLWNGILGVLVAVAYGRQAWGALRLRRGWTQICETEGPCFIVQKDAGAWGLILSLTSESSARPEDLSQGSTIPFQPEYEIFFHLDEGSAGTLRGLFSPGEVLRLRWCEQPSGAGGPILLQIRPALGDAEALGTPLEIRELIPHLPREAAVRRRRRA